jgi:hypothetical protein
VLLRVLGGPIFASLVAPALALRGGHAANDAIHISHLGAKTNQLAQQDEEEEENAGPGAGRVIPEDMRELRSMPDGDRLLTNVANSPN